MKTVPEEKRKKAKRTRFKVYGGLLLIVWGFWVYQPYEYDFIPKSPPNPNPPVDPDTKTLFSDKARVLVITAHPDDSEFYAGGTLLKLSRSGAQMYHVVCTDGDKGYYLFFTNAADNKRVRRAEQTKASSTWKARELVFLGYADGRLRADAPVIAALKAQIERLKPDVILAFDPEYPPRMAHQDHRRSGEAAIEAARQAHFKGWMLLFATHAPNYVDDVSKIWGDRLDLLKIHKSQFHGDRLELITNMISENAGLDGERIHANFGEGFRCLKLDSSGR